MVDSIKSVSSNPRTQSASSTNALRNNPVLLDSIVKTQQQSSGRTALAVPQSAKSGASSSTKLPRGSLVDLIA